MRIPSNRIKSVMQFFHSELRDLHPEEEIDAFIRLAFSHILKMDSARLLLKKEETLTESELLRFNFLVKDLKRGKPLQYILGETEFYNDVFKTDERALIPRPETEELVDWAYRDFKQKDGLTILDIGTGTGCIAISLAGLFKKAIVTAVDIEPDALSLATENATRLNRNVTFLRADAANPGSLPEGEFDIIISNPPYILPSEKDSLPANVAGFEPASALFTPAEDALYFYRSIMEYAAGHLSERGKLYFEIHEHQSEPLNKLASTRFKSVILRNDINGKPRMICAYSPL